MNLKKYFFDPNYRFLVNSSLGFNNKMGDKEYLKKIFKIKIGYDLDLDNPKTFNEKLQWLKLYDRNPLYTKLVDKYEVRDYIKNTIGEKYLVPLLGTYENADDIDFNKLPNRFVLKCNHNSGLGMCICKNKEQLNLKKVRKNLNKGLKEDYYLKWREWPYKDVKRRIIAEEYLDEKTGSITDYKVMCFDGKPELIQVHLGRFTNHTQDFYDINWNKLNLEQDCKSSDIVMKKPVFLDELLQLSETLSKGLKEVRVDWYYVNNQLYFSELTFFDASGFSKFEPSEYDKKLGDLIKL